MSYQELTVFFILLMWNISLKSLLNKLLPLSKKLSLSKSKTWPVLQTRSDKAILSFPLIQSILCWFIPFDKYSLIYGGIFFQSPDRYFTSSFVVGGFRLNFNGVLKLRNNMTVCYFELYRNWWHYSIEEYSKFSKGMEIWCILFVLHFVGVRGFSELMHALLLACTNGFYILCMFLHCLNSCYWL